MGKAQELDKRGDYVERQADVLLEAANLAADSGEHELAMRWQREAGVMYGEAASLARQAAQAYRESE